MPKLEGLSQKYIIDTFVKPRVGLGFTLQREGIDPHNQRAVVAKAAELKAAGYYVDTRGVPESSLNPNKVKPRRTR